MIELALIHLNDVRLASLMIGMTAAATLFSDTTVVTAVIGDVSQYGLVFMAVDA
jgi:hypothetical protein